LWQTRSIDRGFHDAPESLAAVALTLATVGIFGLG
jgi:hypothetical protein